MIQIISFMSRELKLPFNEIQLELLKLFAEPISNEELLEIKSLLVKWRFQKLKKAANQVWKDKNWSAKDMEELLQSNLRKPYKSQNEFLAKKAKK